VCVRVGGSVGVCGCGCAVCGCECVTGGLKDSVEQYDPFNNAGTGWKFDRCDAEGLGECACVYNIQGNFQTKKILMFYPHTHSLTLECA
jgi:hypothetical protein